MLETIDTKIDSQMISENYGRFVIEPLESGFGLTLGNAMRRVLLSALPGAAITAVRIEGVHHEFSTMANMKEDALEFILNVKGVRVRALADHSDTLTLDVTGEREVRAGDIKPSAVFEIANPEHHLATLLTADARLNVQFTIEIGKGYVMGTTGSARDLGVLPIDAVFTPIKRVNYKVEKARVEDRSNYDRLILDVWTDGTIGPAEAVAKSARILIDQFNAFNGLAIAPTDPIVTADAQPQPVSEYQIALEQLDLSSRTFNALRRAGILTIDSLLSRTSDELLVLKNFGRKSCEEVEEKLNAVGLELRSPDEVEEEVELTPEEQEMEDMKKKLQEKFQVREEK